MDLRLTGKRLVERLAAYRNPVDWSQAVREPLHALTQWVDSPQAGPLSEIAQERARQVQQEGWTPDHDDKHADYSLAAAAGSYALNAARPWGSERDLPMKCWPWDRKWWKPGGSTPAGRRRDLVKAGALILAEIERLDRAADKGGQEHD